MEDKKTKLRIIPLGGLEQIGMNITAFEYGDSVIIVDCGMAFPEDDMLGVDLVVPEITYLKENAAKIKGFVFTHGHEDHIGATPYVLKAVSYCLKDLGRNTCYILSCVLRHTFGLLF